MDKFISHLVFFFFFFLGVNKGETIDEDALTKIH